MRTSVSKGLKKETNKWSRKQEREKGRQKQCVSFQISCLHTDWYYIFFSPVNEKSIILVNYPCLHAIQETSEMFLHKEETVYKTLSKVWHIALVQHEKAKHTCPPLKCLGEGSKFECGSDIAVGITNGLYLFSSSGRRERPEFLVHWVPLETGFWLLASSVQCQHWIFEFPDSI